MPAPVGASDAFTNPEVLLTHANARLTPRGRRLIIERSHPGWKQAHIAAPMGTSACVPDRTVNRGDLWPADAARPCHDGTSPHAGTDVMRCRTLK